MVSGKEMLVIIDGYNFLKQTRAQSYITSKERALFVAVMGRYATRKKLTIMIVFDGGPYQWAHKETSGLVDILYSGISCSADDIIHEYMENHQHKEIVLVSADNELNIVASALSIPSINPQDFNELVLCALKGQTKANYNGSKFIKTSVSDNKELDILMESATLDIPTKDADQISTIHNRAASHRAPSKVDRLLHKKLKKL